MKNLRYDGLGFPIYLRGVKTFEFHGEVLPDINHRKLEDAAFRLLLWLPAHFSGSHLAFVRGYMSLSQKAFATILGLKTHATISGWENKKDKPTGMPTTTEVVVRLLMAKAIKDNKFPSHFSEFLQVGGSPNYIELKVA